MVRKRVRWADCDPAGVVYTGRFTDYLMTAVGYFFDQLGNGHYARWVQSLEVDTPCKGMELSFHGALWPEDVFQMACHVGTIRDHSYDLHVEATQDGGRRVFSGRFSPICIRRDARARTAIPAAMLEALRAHQIPAPSSPAPSTPCAPPASSATTAP